ncbi:DnaD domain protein [Sutcliffiella horikoshii]|uniref:DnaD domain protein n=1 Tax=Sutcliffiella horikoshii TaxID=79883 RepID=UPI003CEBB7D4
MEENVKTTKPEDANAEKNEQDSNQKAQKEILIYQLKQISVEQMLRDLSGGLNPSKSEQEIIDKLREIEDFPEEVINTLIYYVLLVNDHKLSQPFIMKIATDWRRKGIKTVEEAMELVKKRKREREERALLNNSITLRLDDDLNTKLGEISEWLDIKENEEVIKSCIKKVYLELMDINQR